MQWRLSFTFSFWHIADHTTDLNTNESMQCANQVRQEQTENGKFKYNNKYEEWWKLPAWQMAV